MRVQIKRIMLTPVFTLDIVAHRIKESENK